MDLDLKCKTYQELLQTKLILLHSETVFPIPQKENGKSKYEFSFLYLRRNTSMKQETNNGREDTKSNLR